MRKIAVNISLFIDLKRKKGELNENNNNKYYEKKRIILFYQKKFFFLFYVFPNELHGFVLCVVCRVFKNIPYRDASFNQPLRNFFF
jgi:hypothetical protein